MSWKYLLALALTQLFARSDTSSPSSVQLDNTRYNKCGRYRCAESGKFDFIQSNVYKYLYTLHVNSTFDKESVTTSELKLEFLVELRIENCEGVMRIDRYKQKEGLSIFDENEVDKIYEDVHKYKLTFSFYDGSILNVCPNSDESVSSLNIKKGILSAFQNRMRRFDIDKFTSEKDVNGICPTHYNLERINGTTLVVRKIKDVANCLERYQLHSVIPTSRYVFQSKYQRWAPLNSSVICHQTIDNNVPTNIICNEDHRLNLFSNHTHGSRTRIKQEFQLLRKEGLYDAGFFNVLHYPDDFSIRDDLSFNHRKPKKSEISELEESESLLQQLCEITSEEFQLDAAGVFTKFIHKARHLSYDALDMLMEKSEYLCSTGRKHVQDSLPFLRSTAAVKLMKEIIMKGNISDSTSTAWLFSISLFSRPDFEVINSVAPLLLEEDPGPNVRLSVSSVIHSYRLWANENDEKEADTRETIVKAITFVESRINKTILDMHPNQDELVILLKSLGNAGVSTDTISYTLAACIRNTLLSAEIRITAIEAHRRLPCNFNEAILLEVYSNRNYEAEVRIAAYLQLMKCPSYSAIKKIKSLLEEEMVNQVGTFVWSHFQNLMKSSLDYRVEIQSILQDFNLQKKFKTDFRKFSKNYETSFYLNDYGVGGAVTTNVIFSTENYIPTYLTLNVTINVFGEVINIGQIDILMKGFEKYAEKFFKNGFSAILDKLEKRISVFRFLRSIPNSLKSRIRSLARYFMGGSTEPTLTMAFKLFGNEIKYRSYRGEKGIEEFLNHFDTNTFIAEFLNGEEIKFDYSTVFMDVSYVAPTAAGIPLNLDAVGIAITNFDTSVLFNITNYETAHEMFVNGKLKPRFSINFEGSMGTDLVYEQTQVQVKSKMYTSTEIEGYFNMNGFDNVTLLFNLPLERYDIFSFESEFYYRNNELNSDIVLEEGDTQQRNVSCFWPILDQTLGLKLCSSHEMQSSPLELLSLVDVLKSPFKFSLFIEKSDRTAKTYSFKYSKTTKQDNESTILVEFETPGSVIPRSMKSTIHLSPQDNNMTIVIYANRTLLEAHGFYKNTPTDKVLNFDVDIDGLKHIEWILELHIRHDKKATVYTPKLYLAIMSKPVAELSGTYKWVEKKSTSQCNVDLQFKTNKFDSNITGYITLIDQTMSSNIHIRYKFENAKNESLNFELNYKDRSTKLITALTGNFKLESTAYPDMNMALDLKYQTSHDRVDTRLEYVSHPFLDDDRKKLYFQFVFSYYKSYNGLKINTFVDVKKEITDLSFKIGLSHQRTQLNSNTVVLLRYAKNKDIIVRVDTFTPQMVNFHYELKINTTLPNVQQPMIVHIRILERREREYDIDFTGAWFSGHTAMAKGVFQDRSNHYGTNYMIKLLVRSRLFTEILLSAKILFNESEQKVTISAEHENTKYSGMITHVANPHDLHETYLEFVYNNTAVYYLNNKLNIPKKEVITELHLDKYRDIRLAARGTLQRWNSDVGLELKWDVNRDPSQKIVISFNTRSAVYASRSEYNARFIFEYPGHISMASFVVQHQENYRSLLLALEMNPTSIIQLSAYSENELFTKGFTKFGCKLITPFENWKESALYYGLYSENQSFLTNGSLVWQENQSITFESRGGYLFEDNITSLTLSSSLNSTLQDLSALAFGLNYTSAINEVYISFLLQPNIKYSLFISVSGMVRYYDKATEYIAILTTRTPFLDYSRTKFSAKLKLMTENRVNGDFHVQLNDDNYALFVKGLLNPFEKTKLCLHILTPFEKYQDLAGVLSYDPEEKQIYLNLTGVKFNFKTEIVYVYNNLSNFHLRLEVVTPFSYLSNMIVLGMYIGNGFDMRFGWNTFTVGLAGITHFNSWTDMEYGVQLFTPILNFKQSSGALKILLKPEMKIVTARIILHNITKVGINFEYNSDKSKVSYQDECDVYYEKDVPGILKTIVLYNALLELDTLMYPTVLGSYYIKQTGKNYRLDAKAAVFFLKLALWNNLDYENNFSFNNTFDMKSSIDMLSSISAYFKIKKVNEHVTNISTDLTLVTFRHKMQGGADILYEYQPIDGALKQIKSKIDGVHNVVLKIYTPFELLEKGEIIIVTQKKNYLFETNVDFITIHTNVSLIGELQYEENNFNVLTKFNMTSDYVTAPPFQLQIIRDFSNPEKRIALVLKEPTETGNDFQDMLSVRSTWYVDSRDRISLTGELKSPLKILKELKASLLYVHERQAETYYLEAYMKYLNLTEMKARANLKQPNITLNIESSMEGLRNAHFVGSLDRIGAGQQKIDAVMVTNSNYRIQGFSSVTDQTPFSIKGKLLRGKEGVEISSVEMYVKKKIGGYNVLAALYSKGKSLNVETEITDLPNNSRIITLKIKTGIGVVESLDINAELKLQHPGIYQLTVKGDSSMEETKGSSVSTVEIWFRNGICAIFASLDSASLKGNSEFFLAWKPPYHYFGGSKINFHLNKKFTELLNMNIYFHKINETASFENVTTGLMINLNNKWIMESNFTFINSTNDQKVVSYLVLPNNNTYSFAGGLKHSDKFDQLQHLIIFSRPLDTPCYTLSDIDIAGVQLDGLFAFKCGIKETLFMIDKFNGRKTSNKLELTNSLRSNTLANTLTTNVNYEKRLDHHIVNLKFYYPSTKLISVADVDFQSTDNFDLFVNTSTPFASLRNFATEIRSKTDPDFYWRFGKIHLQDRPAFVNFTHTKHNYPRYVWNDGLIQVEFPIATWHQGILTYTYENTSSKINGLSEIFYNGDKVIHTNFTRNSTITRNAEIFFTHLDIGNKLVPIGVNYIREISNEDRLQPAFDLKRLEVYKLHNASAFNLTSEMLVENANSYEWTTLRVLNFNRSIVSKWRTDSGTPYENIFYVILKPELWFSCHFKTNRTIRDSAYKKLFDVNIAYPRRNFSVISDFGYGDRYLKSQFIVQNFLLTPYKTIGVIFDTKKPLNNLRETSVTVFHPSLTKNVTLSINVSSARAILADMKMDFEYSNDINRKLELSCVIEDFSKRTNRDYTLHIIGKHPLTKFKLNLTAALKSETGIHFIGNHILYKRAYLPDQFWNGIASLNTKDNVVAIERVSTRALIQIRGDYKTRETVHILNTLIAEGTSTAITANTNISGKVEFDLFNKIANALINLTADASDRLQIEGNIRENREAKFNIWRTYNDFNFPQMTFYLALNHSRFLSSALLWRTDIGTNILKVIRSTISYMWVSAQDSVEFWTQFLRSEATETLTAVWEDAQPELKELIEDCGDIKTIQDNINYFKSVLNDSYNNNEFFLQDIHNLYTILSQEMSFMDKLGSLPKIVSEVVESMGETGEVIKKSLIWVVDTVKQFYNELLRILDELVEGKAEVYTAKFIKKGTEKFDSFIKDLHISFVMSTESAVNEMLQTLSLYRKKILNVFEPTFIEIVHHVDTTLWTSTKNLVDFIYAKKNDLVNSPSFLRSVNFTQKLDEIYKDFSKNDLITNVRKYLGLLYDTVYEYYISNIPYREELTTIGNEIINEIKELNKLPPIMYTVDNFKLMYNQTVWLYEYFDVGGKMQRVLPFLYKQYQENSFTALEITMKNHKPKTKVIFSPSEGVIKMEQKLPFPWHAFNETPTYEEIEEYKFLKRIQAYITSSKSRIWSIYSTLITLLDPQSWFPPFKGQAHIVGFHNFITFDSIHIPFYGNYCKYLLSNDFMGEEFSLILNSDEFRAHNHQSISVVIGSEVVTIQFAPARIRVDSKRLPRFPLELNNTLVYYDRNIITIQNKNGFSLKCNEYHRICTINLSGWFYGKVNGLLGTMNNEYYDDLTYHSNKHSGKNEQFLWTLSPDTISCPETVGKSMMPPDEGVNEKCNELFLNSSSSFEPCFSEVDPGPFYNICITRLDDKHVCSTGMAYVQSCSANSVPLRIPAVCVSCTFGPNLAVIEGQFHQFSDKSAPQSSDVIFIVEAKACNRDILTKKDMPQLISLLSKELTNVGISRNRYSLVVFGGDGIFADPHSIILNGNVFSNSTFFYKYFEKFPVGSGDSDIFNAIRFAVKLQFRAGVSKTFILMPCSNCDPKKMTLDYSVLHHALAEKSIRLHILMNDDFPSNKTKTGKVLFGVDSFTAYTKDDSDRLEGDVDLLKQTKLTKSLLGYCTPLALETNGSLFTATLLSSPANMLTKFLTTFSKRVAQSAKPEACQECECHSDENGVPYVECISCAYPTPVYFDFDTEEENDFPAILSLESSTRN